MGPGGKVTRGSPSPQGITQQGKVTVLKASRINVRNSPSPSPDQSPPTHQTFKFKVNVRSEEVSPGSSSPVEDESGIGRHKMNNPEVINGGSFLHRQLASKDDKKRPTHSSPNPPSVQVKKIRVKGGTNVQKQHIIRLSPSPPPT